MRRIGRFAAPMGWAIACLLSLSLAVPALAIDKTAAKKVGADQMIKKSPADAAVGKKCISCHGAEDDPGIYGEWKKSTHAAKNVDCYDCHKAKQGEKAAFAHHGAFIQVIVTPNTCANCHAAEVAQQQRSHHAKAGNILASLDNLLGEVIGGPAAVNAGCLQCHGSTRRQGASDAANLAQYRHWPHQSGRLTGILFGLPRPA
jgi:hydroxylamine dehydrogenase